MQPRVVISHRITKEVVEMLSRSFIVVPHMSSTPLSRDELLHRAQGARAMLVSGEDGVDRDFVAQCPSLQIIASTSDKARLVDIDACTDCGVWLTVVSGLPGSPAAELEAVANIYEAILGEKPKGALNIVSAKRRMRKKPLGREIPSP